MSCYKLNNDQLYENIYCGSTDSICFCHRIIPCLNIVSVIKWSIKGWGVVGLEKVEGLFYHQDLKRCT